MRRNIFKLGFDIQEGEYVGEVARRSVGKFDKTNKILNFSNHIFHTNGIDNFFKCVRCPSCDTFFHKSEMYRPSETYLPKERL